MYKTLHKKLKIYHALLVWHILLCACMINIYWTADTYGTGYVWRVWRYQRGNQNPYIEEQTTQWPREKEQKDKQRSTKHTHKTKDWVTRTPLKIRGELRCSGKVGSSCSTSGTRCVNLFTNPVISHEWGKDWEVFTTKLNISVVICDTHTP